MKDKIWIVTAFVLTFAVGVLVGAIIVRNFGPPPPFAAVSFDQPGGRHFSRHEEWSPIPSVEMLHRQLGLNETQQQQVAGIVEKYREQFQEHFRQIHPTMQAIIMQMRAEIEGVLKPEQLEKFRREFPRRERRGFGPRPTPKDSAAQLPE